MNDLQTTDRPQLPTEEQWGRPNRQRILRSRAAELLANNADEDEIAAAIDEDMRTQLELADNGICTELSTAAGKPAYEDALAAELGKYMRLTGGGWTAEDRAEWINGATDELMDYPLSMLLPELAIARKREPWPNKLVPAIVEKLEPRLARLKAEAETIHTLRALAVGMRNVRAPV